MPDEKWVEGSSPVKSEITAGNTSAPSGASNMGEGGSPLSTEALKRPESATSGEISSLTVDATSNANSNVDQSPARSPHARSWTVPGV